MYGADPRLADLGSKTGCRRLFAEVGVPYPLGVEDLHSLDEIVDALIAMRAQRPGMASAIVKLNEGVSGAGNAVVRHGRAAGAGSCRRAPVDPTTAGGHGAGVGATPSTPTSRQVRRGRWDRRGADRGRRAAEPERPAARASRAEQSSCSRPTTSSWWRQRPELPRLRLPRRCGVRADDHRACEVRSGNGWRRTARSAGSPSTSSWCVTAAAGRRTRSSSTCARGDHPPIPHPAVSHRRSLRPGDGAVPHAAGPREAPGRNRPPRVGPLRGLVPTDLFDVVARHGLHFDQSRQAGIVFHMISWLTEHGRVGLTGDRGHARGGRPPIPRGRADPAGRGAVGVAEPPLPG